ncbi:MAG: hypothetical protein FVQ79_00110 [Planctomycetes bacterium]|nr:hypothetical protein [Planctomycetota bacterium]
MKDKSFTQRRLEKLHEAPDYSIVAYVTGVKDGNTGMVHWQVSVEGEDDPIRAAGILERAVEVLRDE